MKSCYPGDNTGPWKRHWTCPSETYLHMWSFLILFTDLHMLVPEATTAATQL